MDTSFIEKYSLADQWLLLIVGCIDMALMLAIFTSIGFYFYLLQTKWLKLRHRPFIYSLLFLDLTIILFGILFVVLDRGARSLLYLNNLLALTLIFLLALFASAILELFSVLIPWVTAFRLKIWRITLSVTFAISCIPVIIQLYYGFSLDDPVNDTPSTILFLNAIGGGTIGIMGMQRMKINFFI